MEPFICSKIVIFQHEKQSPSNRVNGRSSTDKNVLIKAFGVAPGPVPAEHTLNTPTTRLCITFDGSGKPANVSVGTLFWCFKNRKSTTSMKTVKNLDNNFFNLTSNSSLKIDRLSLLVPSESFHIEYKPTLKFPTPTPSERSLRSKIKF